MGVYVANQLIKAMIKKRVQVQGARVLVMGITFKENCPDIRNTRVINVIEELSEYDCQVHVYDPLVSIEKVKREYPVTVVEFPRHEYYDAIVIAVAHDQFKQMGIGQIHEF